MRVLFDRAVGAHARVRFTLVAVDGDGLAGVVCEQQAVGELEHFELQAGDVVLDAVMLER